MFEVHTPNKPYAHPKTEAFKTRHPRLNAAGEPDHAQVGGQTPAMSATFPTREEGDKWIKAWTKMATILGHMIPATLQVVEVQFSALEKEMLEDVLTGIRCRMHEVAFERLGLTIPKAFAAALKELKGAGGSVEAQNASACVMDEVDKADPSFFRKAIDSVKFKDPEYYGPTDYDWEDARNIGEAIANRAMGKLIADEREIPDFPTLGFTGPALEYRFEGGSIYGRGLIYRPPIWFLNEKDQFVSDTGRFNGEERFSHVNARSRS